MGLFINNVTECPHCGRTIELTDSHCCPYCGREVELSTQAKIKELLELIKDGFWAVATFLVGIILTLVMASVLSKDGFSMQSLGLFALGLAFLIGGFFWTRSQIKQFFKK